MQDVRILVQRYGDVEEKFAEAILEIMNECYGRLRPHDVHIVDLYLFTKSTMMNSILSQEKKSLGITTSPFEASFFATHDAWRGTPRVMVALDMMENLPKLVSTGSLRHETAHTVLHGSLEYYIFHVPRSLRKLGSVSKITFHTLEDVLYLISIAVKDYEVTRLLHRRGYVEDQAAYNKHLLKPSGDEVLALKIAQINPASKLVFVASILKTLCCAAPILSDEKYGGEMEEAFIKSINYLPKSWPPRVQKIIKSLSSLGESTHENVEILSSLIMAEFYASAGV